MAHAYAKDVQMKTTELQKDVLALWEMKNWLLNSFKIIRDYENVQIPLILEWVKSYENKILDLDNTWIWNENEVWNLEAIKLKH